MSDMKEIYYFSRVQFFSVLGSLVLVAVLFHFIRRRKLREEYSLLWLFVFILFFVTAVYGELLQIVSRFLGILYPPATLFLLLIIGVILLMLHFSVIISDLKRKVNLLSIKLALLEEKQSGREDDDGE